VYCVKCCWNLCIVHSSVFSNFHFSYFCFLPMFFYGFCTFIRKSLFLLFNISFVFKCKYMKSYNYSYLLNSFHFLWDIRGVSHS
jgi:hypothetical protein